MAIVSPPYPQNSGGRFSFVDIVAQRRCSLLLAALLCPPAAFAGNDPPALELLRFEEDYEQYLSANGELLERLKHWSAVGESSWVSLGGEFRARYEYTRNPAFGADPQDPNGVWLQRTALHADWHLNRRVRVFVQIYSAVEEGRVGGPSPVDENRLEFQNAFVDVDLLPESAQRLRLRIGRQELNYGSGRLINVREGPNVRRTYDAVRIDWFRSRFNVSAFAAQPRKITAGAFDDRGDDDIDLWGLYATLPVPFRALGQIDAYYLGYRDKTPGFVQPITDERRHSLGVRAFGDAGGWDWNWEAVVQYGDTNDSDIRAWTMATDTGYTFQEIQFIPRLALSLNIASGDSDANDDMLETFNALLPRGNYFSQAAVVGPRSFYNAQGFLTITSGTGWTGELAINSFWRLEKEDGVYTPAGNVLRTPAGSSAHHVGVATSLSLTKTWGRYFDVTGIYTHFAPGQFIKETGPSDSINFVELTARFRF